MAIIESKSRMELSLMEDLPNEKLPPIQEFYRGQNIFITGSTGFIGKLVLEKILRTCPGLGSIYLLVRPKKLKNIQQRIEEIFDDVLFERLKTDQPKFRNQIVLITGDCSQPNLGISSEDHATLIREVSIVFHIAATVKFNEKLKLAVAINVRGTKNIVNLCKEIHNLKSFVYVSTAYANCPQNVIEEKFYDAPMDSDKLLTLMECMEDKLVEYMTPQLLKKWPNTYTFTKAMAEDVIRKQADDLPVGIFRPAIVISTYREPIRGWIDNYYGPSGIIVSIGIGLLRSILCYGWIATNMVPADLVTNALIACAWDTANIRVDRIDDHKMAIIESKSRMELSLMEDLPNEKLPPIQEFYRGQNIFITGSTGFIGKLVLEKILRTCPGLGSIYLLVRPKKLKNIQQRIEEIFDDVLFERLKTDQPKFRNQIVLITGDCSQPNLGISSEDHATLIREVSIVFHIAATVKFNEKLKLAVAINVRGTKNIVNLCKEIHNLKSFVYVSTAYANCPQNVIEEKFYDAPMDSDKLLTLMECMEDKLVEYMTPQLLKKWPNTYTFTKAMAEDVIRKQADDLPVGIFRPAIVISTYREPIRGWIDNYYGPSGIIVSIGIGLLRSILCYGWIATNMVPADLVTNALIACAWDTANIRVDRIDDHKMAIIESKSRMELSLMEDLPNEKLPPIQEFYRGQNIFITGSTGFIGKLVLEKILRTCPGLGSIYLLVRPKKLKNIQQRIEEIFDDVLFERLKTDQPKFRNQIVLITGDCSQPNLGISSEDHATLIREVSIVFHIAATVKFNEKLKLAVAINVRGTKNIVNLCKEIHNLKSFVYVSTAYANCPQNVIEEKFYDAPMDSDKLLTLMECMEDKLVEYMTPQLLKKWPNT